MPHEIVKGDKLTLGKRSAVHAKSARVQEQNNRAVDEYGSKRVGYGGNCADELSAFGEFFVASCKFLLFALFKSLKYVKKINFVLAICIAFC